jgi:flavin-dependent dehydrogenase
MRVATIGSGPGGAVVASELIERGFEVIVFEKGDVHPQSKYNPYSKEEMLNKYVGAGITAAFVIQK